MTFSSSLFINLCLFECKLRHECDVDKTWIQPGVHEFILFWYTLYSDYHLQFVTFFEGFRYHLVAANMTVWWLNDGIPDSFTGKTCIVILLLIYSCDVFCLLIFPLLKSFVCNIELLLRQWQCFETLFSTFVYVNFSLFMRLIWNILCPSRKCAHVHSYWNGQVCVLCCIFSFTFCPLII